MKRNQHRDREGVITKTGLKPGECDIVAVNKEMLLKTEEQAESNI